MSGVPGSLSREAVPLLMKAGLALGLFLLIRLTAMAPLWAAGIATLASLWVFSTRPRNASEAGLTPLMVATCWAAAQMVVMQVLLLAMPAHAAVALSMFATFSGERMLGPTAAAVPHG